ncbi:hypothetical protein RvY_19229 [Ramazzottius varieornatus]|uniref:Uncharacterized protein n=1 Tax=Ramazzottius varieornatus TaxID=947166 RepID=A0A1D1W8P7_RAMVA|nr:hypothetical protein RvY_19229 [Ramazzottius varieornatus]
MSNPPEPTGSVACRHGPELISVLVISDRLDRTTSSNSRSNAETFHTGEHRRMYSKLDRQKHFLSGERAWWANKRFRFAFTNRILLVFSSDDVLLPEFIPPAVLLEG